MSNVVHLHSQAPSVIDMTRMKRGTILAIVGGSGDVELSDGTVVSCTLATRDAAVGDTAIVAAVEDALYVLGAATAQAREATALRCERDPASGRQVVRLPEGPVEIRTTGDLTWVTDGAVRVEAAEQVTLCAGPEAATGAAVTVGADRVRLRAPAVDVDAGALEVAARRASIAAEALTVTVELLRRTLGTLETDVGRIIERAESSVRETKDLALTRAGRLRMVVERTASLLSERFVVKTEEDVKIDGSKIHLG